MFGYVALVTAWVGLATFGVVFTVQVLRDR